MKSGWKPRVLLLLLERSVWREARSCSYTVQLGLEEGLSAHGVKFFTATTPWFQEAKKILEGQSFDQVWIEIARHETLEDEFLQWMASLAPVRVGFLVESLNYSPEEESRWLDLGLRKRRVESRLRYMTHAVACDEVDAGEIKQTAGVPSIWWPQAIPERFICDSISAPGRQRGIFCGSVYGDRESLLGDPALKGLLEHFPSPETQTGLPVVFDLLHGTVRKFLRKQMPHDDLFRRFGVRALNMSRRQIPLSMGLFIYMQILRGVRRKCFSLWLDQLRFGAATVNLPGTVKTYQGRVVESMAAGRPVISWEIPGRPRNRELFEEGREILLFKKDDPESLADQIRRAIFDPILSRKVAENARNKIRRLHTMEKRVGQILDWIESGTDPIYT